MQEETRLHRLAEEAAVDAERESNRWKKRVQDKAAELARALPKAGTSERRDINALQHEMVARRLKEASASGNDEEEALRLAAEDMHHMMSDPAIASYSLLKLNTRVSHVAVDTAYQTMWASCSNPTCSLRLTNGYFICKGCIHAAWCCVKCYEAHKDDHTEVRILCPTTLILSSLSTKLSAPASCMDNTRRLNADISISRAKTL